MSSGRRQSAYLDRVQIERLAQDVGGILIGSYRNRDLESLKAIISKLSGE